MGGFVPQVAREEPGTHAASVLKNDHPRLKLPRESEDRVHCPALDEMAICHVDPEFLYRRNLLVQYLLAACLELAFYIAVGVRCRSVVPGV